MTNREWLNSLNNADFSKALYEVVLKVGKWYTDSELGITQWLGEEHIPAQKTVIRVPTIGVKLMSIEDCRARGCVHVSERRRRRNCGVVDCSSYPQYFSERWAEEEDEEFDNCTDEE